LQREEGKFAICANCGNQSADYDICDSCNKPLPQDAKLYAPDAATMRKKARLDAQQNSAKKLAQAAEPVDKSQVTVKEADQTVMPGLFWIALRLSITLL